MPKTQVTAPKKTTVKAAVPSKTVTTLKDGRPFFSTDVRPGSLIIVEGPDGSGKSTQLLIVKSLLEANGFYCHMSQWNSDLKIHPLTKAMKKGDLHMPAPVFDMIFAADFVERYINDIKGKLKAGMIVLCDRYFYTALARGYARGLDINDLRPFYDAYFPTPDLALYFRLPIEVAMQRAVGRTQLKHYEAGMDMQFSDNIIESFKAFQTRVLAGYDTVAKSDNLHIVDGVAPVYKTTPDVIKIVADYIERKYEVKFRG